MCCNISDIKLITPFFLFKWPYKVLVWTSSIRPQPSWKDYQRTLLLWCKSSLMTSKRQFVTETLKFPSIVGPPLRVRANSYILISLSLLLLPLMSPPIPFRANSKLICKSQRQRNWCLIFELGNRIMWVMRKGWKKDYRQGERQKRRQLDIKYELLCRFLFCLLKSSL